MSLLREIQNAAIDSNVELPVLLRKCKLLASRLGNSDFTNWVEYELNGYPEEEKCPSYRILKVSSKGHFSGAFGSGLRNADIPTANLPEELRHHLENFSLKQGVAALETLAKESKPLQAPWDSNITARFAADFYENMNCLQAWRPISQNSLVAILDIVKNKILSFCIEIERSNPDAGESLLNSEPIQQEKVTQIFNTNIFGSGHNIATGSTHVNQTNKNNDKALFDGLLNSISTVDGEKNKINELKKIVEAMQRTQGTNSFMEHYKRFMSCLSDHAGVFNVAVAPYMPALANLVTWA